jgi:hypothetical protein
MPVTPLQIGISANNQIPTWSLLLPKENGEVTHYTSDPNVDTTIPVPANATDALISTGGITYMVSAFPIAIPPANSPVPARQVQNREMIKVAGLSSIHLLTEDSAPVNIQWFNSSISA